MEAGENGANAPGALWLTSVLCAQPIAAPRAAAGTAGAGVKRVPSRPLRQLAAGG